MDFLKKLFFAALLISAAAIDGAQAYAMVSGTVFCDQCKDGERSLFDYPIYGVKVIVACADSNGQITMSREETTNLFGNYAIRFDGTPDLNGCYAQVSGTEQGSMGCGGAAGPPQSLRLVFRMFDMEMYIADSLLSQPDQPMPFCPRSANPVPPPVTIIPPTPPLQLPPVPQLPQLPPLPKLPPLPQLPPLPPLPPVPFLEASACQYENWTNPEYRCYWRAVNPDTKVAVVFGLAAASRYGTDITLWQGLQGKGDPYLTLLRESITALLNSYNTIQFPYPTITVIQLVNLALTTGSPRNVLFTALHFKRANSGYGLVTCNFTTCK